jgi:hypothetical protein
MSRVKLLYFLFNKRKKPLYVHDTGIIMEGNAHYQKLGGQPAHLSYDPDGWEDVLVKYARNIKWWGVFRDMTVPMNYVGDGAKILKDIFVKGGVEGICYLGIAKLDQLTLPYNYRSWYLSELNFVKYNEEKNGIKIEALEGGLSKFIKAFETTKFQIPIDADPEHISVLMDGMELENSATWFVSDGMSVDPDYALGNHIVQIDIVSKEIGDIGGVFSTTRIKVPNNNVNIKATGQHFFDATSAGVMHIDYDFFLNVEFIPPPAMNPAAALAVLVRKIDTTGFGTNAHTLHERYAGLGQIITGNHHIFGSADIPVNPGDQLFLYTMLQPEGTTGDEQTRFQYYGNEPFFKMSYTFREKPSVVQAHNPLRLVELLVSKLSNGQFTKVKSTLLTSLEHELAILSGDALRGISNTYITTSLQDYFKSIDTNYGIGLGIENGDTLVIEELPYFFQDVVIHDCGDVVNAKLVPAEDLLVNTMSIGYKEQEYKEINGRSEFNQGQKWKSPITKLTKDLDKVSVYRADPFGIELMRINFGQKKTTDSKSDPETFMLRIRPQFNSFTGNVLFSNSFNLFMIPGQAGLISQFKKGTRMKVTGTASNNNIYTLVSDAAAIGADLWGSVLSSANPGGIDFVVENAPAATIELLTYVLNRPAFTSVTGLLHPDSAFNIELSPKRGMLANGAYLRSIFDLLDGAFLEMTSADKNTDLTTTIGGVTISENESVQIGNLPARLFRPYYITFTTESPVNLLEIMNVNPYGKIKFTVDGEVMYGYLMDGGLKPSTNDVQQWKLLCHPSNNLAKFYKK